MQVTEVFPIPTVTVWDAASLRPLLTLRNKVGDVHAVSFSPDGRTFLTGEDDGAEIWDVASGRHVRTLRANPSQRITTAAYFPDGSRVVTGGLGRGAQVWDATSGALLGTLDGHLDDVSAVVVQSNGNTIITASHDGTIRFWNAQSFALSMTLIPIGRSDYIVLRTDGTYDLSEGAKNRVILVDGTDWSPVTPAYEAAHRRANRP
jgi:WD40 repeat protein